MDTIKCGYVVALEKSFLTRKLEWKDGEVTPSNFQAEEVMPAIYAFFEAMCSATHGDVRKPTCIYPAILHGAECKIIGNALSYEETEVYLQNKGAL